jgi:hypothetical protein
MFFKFLFPIFFSSSLLLAQNNAAPQKQILKQIDRDSIKSTKNAKKENYFKSKILKANSKAIAANEKRIQKNLSLNPHLRTIEFTDYDKLNYIEYLKDIKSSILENLTTIVDRELKNEELDYKEKRDLMFKMQRISNFNIKEKSKNQGDILYNIEYTFDHLVELKNEEYSLEQLANIVEDLIVMRDKLRLNNEILQYRMLLVEEVPKNQRSDFFQENAKLKVETIENKQKRILSTRTEIQNKKNDAHSQMVSNQEMLREKVREAKLKKELLLNEKLNKNHQTIASLSSVKTKVNTTENTDVKANKIENELNKDIDLAYETMNEDLNKYANATVEELEAKITELEKIRDNIVLQHALIIFRENSSDDVASRAMR